MSISMENALGLLCYVMHSIANTQSNNQDLFNIKSIHSVVCHITAANYTNFAEKSQTKNAKRKWMPTSSLLLLLINIYFAEAQIRV